MAGLQVGDQIVMVNDVPISTFAQLQAKVQTIRSGDGQLVLQIRRNGLLHMMRAKLRGPTDEVNSAAGNVAKQTSDSDILQEMRSRVADLRAAVAAVAEAATGDALQQARQAIAHAGALAEHLQTEGQSVTQLSDQQVDQVQSDLNELADDIHALATDGGGTARKDLDKAKAAVSSLQIDVQMLSGTAPDTFNSSVPNARTLTHDALGNLRTLADTATDDATSLADRAIKHAVALIDQLKSDAHTATQPADRQIDAAHRQVGDLQREVSALANSVSGPDRQRLDDVVARLKSLDAQLQSVAEDLANRPQDAQAR